jgi:hypothetical protein
MSANPPNSESPGFLSGLATKALAVIVLVVAAWFLFKVVIGIVTAVAWIAAIVVGIVAVFWAMAVLRR